MIERIVRFVSAVSFHRGLMLGAMVGAAIAGSTIWSRLRPPGRHSVSAELPASDRPAATDTEHGDRDAAG